MTDEQDWFDPDERTGDRGLRFSCTMCGNCCSGPPGVVRLDSNEVETLASRLGITREEFMSSYTQFTTVGLSLVERRSEHGWDCVFLDRQSQPGRAICGVYDDRPAQCRSWPFWKRNLTSPDAWESARRICPGMDTGTLIPPEHVRIRRDESEL